MTPVTSDRSSDAAEYPTDIHDAVSTILMQMYQYHACVRDWVLSDDTLPGRLYSVDKCVAHTIMTPLQTRDLQSRRPRSEENGFEMRV